MGGKILTEPRRGAILVVLLVAALTATILAGCRDDLVAPTQGFLEVRTGGVYDVEIYVDGEFAGFGPGILGPLPAGSYLVEVRRDCFAVEPAAGVETQVRPVTTAAIEFALELREFGAVTVKARDELLENAIAGAEIFLEGAPGVYESTGLVTPAEIDSLPCGTARFRLRADGYEESPPIAVDVDTGSSDTLLVELAPLRGALAEMFTHIACVNCPVAADTLEAIHADLPGEAFVIEWHVVSNYPLGDGRWRQRLTDYLGAAYQTVPTTIFGGAFADTLVGCECATLSLYRQRFAEELAECASGCPVGLAIASADITAGGAQVSLRAKWRGGALPGNLELLTVLIENDVVAGGYGSPYQFVAREIDERALSFGVPGEIDTVNVSLPVPTEVNPANAEIVAFVQSGATREILQVAGSAPVR